VKAGDKVVGAGGPIAAHGAEAAAAADIELSGGRCLIGTTARRYHGSGTDPCGP